MRAERHAHLSFRRAWPSLLLTVVAVSTIAVLFWASPLGQRLENHFGLELAFLLRGDRPAPPDTRYVAISPASALALGQDSIYDLDNWDRSLFARLVDRLVDAGVSVIVFDVLFARAGSAQDAVFADAIRRAGNVVLLSWVDRSLHTGPSGNDLLVQIDRLEAPAAVFGDAAHATAPMLLRKGIRMDRFATFPTVAGRVVPSVPTVALATHRRGEMHDLRDSCAGSRSAAIGGEARETTAGLADELLSMRAAWSVDAAGTGPAPSEACVDARRGALGNVITADNERYFNFYGKPGALAGPAFHELLEAGGERLAQRLAGKVVFVGIADNTAINPPDSFQVAIGGRGISGVELAATAFANLSHGEDLQRLDPLRGGLLLVVFGAVIGLVFFLLPRKPATIAVLACAGIYLGTAAVLFSRSHLWLPLIVPLFVQAPLTLALGWRLKLLEFERLTDTLMHFMSRWLREKILRHEVVGAEPELRYGVCLHSDVQGYTGLSERLRTDPLRLKALEGEYWKLVDEQIEAHQGERLDISGDGMTCVWTAATPRSEIFGHACRAALEIQHAVDRFNAQHTDTPFHTRIGLHAGNVTLGLIGGKGHYSLAVGGDVANTAARLESDINKVLHTSVLISDAVRVAPEVCVTRRVGTFVPRGKSQAVAVCEMRDGSREPPVDIARFESALTAFEAGDWGSAQAQFEQLHRDFAADGPSAFYVKILARYATGERRPPAGRPPGVIDFNEPWLMRELEA